jgi:hypothetical protein
VSPRAVSIVELLRGTASPAVAQSVIAALSESDSSLNTFTTLLLKQKEEELEKEKQRIGTPAADAIQQCRP